VINIKFSENASIDPSRLAQFVAGHKGAQFSPNGTLRFNLKSTHAEDVLGRLTGLLQELSGMVVEAERVS